jgi:DedD protein
VLYYARLNTLEEFMAERKEADQEFNPRHRIVGAVVLVALAVVLLPLLLSDRPPDTRTAGTADSPLPETRVVTRPVAPLSDKPVSSMVPAPAEEPASATVKTRTVAVPVESSPSTPAAPVETVAPPASKKPASAPAPAATATKPAVKEKGWVVQVGVFSQIDNAKRLQDKLRKKGYSVSLDPPVPETGKTVRVEVGPYKDTTAAKAAVTRIQSEFGIKGVVRAE